MVASSSLIEQERNDSDAKHLSNRLILVWCSCEIPDDINMPAACYRYFSDDSVHDSTVLSENSRQMSIGLRAIIIPALVWEVLYPLQPLNEESGSVQKGQKKESFFSWKLSPREKQLFSACESQPPSVPSKYSPVRHRSSIEQQATATPATTADEEADLFVGNAPEFSREIFSSFVSSREHRRRRSRLTCCRITRIDPRQVSVRELLKFLALSRPSRIIIQPPRSNSEIAWVTEEHDGEIEAVENTLIKLVTLQQNSYLLSPPRD